MSSIHNSSDATFAADVHEAGVPVLVDFWAPWCGPCKMIAPLLEEAAVTYGERLRVVKINVDENRDEAGRHGVRGIPTMILFDGANVKGTKIGAVNAGQLKAFLDENL